MPSGVPGATVIKPVAGSSVTFGSLEVVEVIVMSAGSTATPFNVSEARTDDVTPPSAPLIGAKVSGSASIAGASTVTVTVDVVPFVGLFVSQISYVSSYVPAGVPGATSTDPSGLSVRAPVGSATVSVSVTSAGSTG